MADTYLCTANESREISTFQAAGSQPVAQSLNPAGPFLKIDLLYNALSKILTITLLEANQVSEDNLDGILKQVTIAIQNYLTYRFSTSWPSTISIRLAEDFNQTKLPIQIEELEKQIRRRLVELVPLIVSL